MRDFKEGNPISYTYGALRQNARRRKKEFNLTLEEFTTFVKESGYIEGKGIKPESLTIDRIDSSKGYSIDNIQVISMSDNSSKGDGVPF